MLERGLHAYIPGGFLVLFLAGLIWGQGRDTVSEEGLCPPRGFLISFVQFSKII